MEDAVNQLTGFALKFLVHVSHHSRERETAPHPAGRQTGECRSISASSTAEKDRAELRHEALTSAIR